MAENEPSGITVAPRTGMQRMLDRLELIGNKLPDPAMIFVIALLIVWVVSAVLSKVEFADADPRTVKRDAAGQVIASEPIKVKNMLLPEALTTFVARMVKTLGGVQLVRCGFGSALR